jgi:hypothetical protein
MNVVLAREFRVDVIAAFDHRHFRTIRPLTPHDAFRLLPTCGFGARRLTSGKTLSDTRVIGRGSSY